MNENKGLGNDDMVLWLMISHAEEAVRVQPQMIRLNGNMEI